MDAQPLVANPADHLYHYGGVCVDAYDADTVRIDLDLGFGLVQRRVDVRLSRIDAPEMRGASKAAGTAARDYLRSLVIGRRVVVRTLRAPSGADTQEKYGRYLAELHVKAAAGEWLNVNDDLVARGFAVYRTY